MSVADRRVIDFNRAARQTDPAAASADYERRLATLRAELQRRAPELVREIYPQAVIAAGKARLGHASGTAGDAMVIELSGDKAGVWKDHATGEGGDLIDLWCLTQNYDSKGAGFLLGVADLEQHVGLGNRGPAFAGKVARHATAQAALPKPAERTTTLERTHVYFAADGSTVLAQALRLRYDDGNGKTFRVKNAKGEWKFPDVRPLYNLPGIALEPVVVMVEGEKCVEALEAIGIAATSCLGGSSAPIGKTDWSPLRGKRVILWPDNDDAGRDYMARLGSHLAAVVGCDVALVDVPASMPPKWDVADALAGGDASVALALLKAADAPRALALAAPGPARFILLDLDELEAIKPPPWLFNPLIPAAALAALVGPPGTMKSFLAIGWALSLAYAMPWLGERNKEDPTKGGFKSLGGPVVYVAGEGQAGVSKRVKAWRKSNGKRDVQPAHQFKVLTEGVDMPGAELDDLIAAIAKMDAPPVLIVLDTLARTFGAGDENSSEDMGRFVKACDKLRRATGACVLVIHHNGKDATKGSRGSSALPGAVDVLMSIERKSPTVLILRNRAPYGKMKDAEEFDDLGLSWSPVLLDEVDEDGDQVGSLVLIRGESVIDDGEAEARPKARPGAENEGRVMEALRTAAEAGQPSLGTTRIEAMTGINRGTIHRVCERLVEGGHIERIEGGGATSWRVA